jgi:hypothetical protein
MCYMLEMTDKYRHSKLPIEKQHMDTALFEHYTAFKLLLFQSYQKFIGTKT